MLASVQAGRAIAALLVLLFHNSRSIFALGKYLGYEPLGPVFDFGDAGVNFFFVLSGFIILHAHWRDLGQAGRLGSYLWKRFRRIYLIYWVVLIVIVPVYFIVPNFGKGYETNALVILSSFLLVHIGSGDGVLIVSWTLFHEVLFYALFAVAIVRPLLGFGVMALWLAASAGVAVCGSTSATIGFYASPLHLLFGLGMLVAWHFHRGPRLPAAAPVGLSGLALFVGAGIVRAYELPLPITPRGLDLVFGVASAMMLAGAVDLERRGRLHIPGWLKLTGDASYSIYLTHFLILSLLAKLLLAGHGNLLSPVPAYIVLAGLTAGVGILFHLGVERPLLARFSGRAVSTRLRQEGAASIPTSG